MTEIFKTDNIKISLNIKGCDQYTKISCPIRYGIYSEIETEDFILQFDLNNEIKIAIGKGKKWPHPSEWLKRNMGNDWIYYSTGGYTGVFEATGEYYLPNFSYPTNSILGGKPFKEEPVARIVSSWYDIICETGNSLKGINGKTGRFIETTLENSRPEKLKEKSKALFCTTEGRVSVLPPDARHVDYDVIPLTISKGCLYNCRFCRIKTGKPFTQKTRQDIKNEIKKLKAFYGKDIVNYNSIFLGQHDALNADKDLILFAAEQAYDDFNFKHSFMKGANLFLFGSVDALIKADSGANQGLFKALNASPWYTYINIGLESADQETLDFLGKPITEAKVEKGFQIIQKINDLYENIEISCNFIMDENLPKNHYPSFLKLARYNLPHFKPKGCVYMSHLGINTFSRQLLFKFNKIKTLSRVPTFLYIIQRL